MSTLELDKFIRHTALSLGFSKIGITPAIVNPIASTRLNSWISLDYHANMKWMENRLAERKNIHNYFPNAKSVISLAINYFTGNANNESLKISNYAWGDDYHEIIKPRLYKLLSKIKIKNPETNGIVCVDTSPIMEKDFAQRAGIGWIGKNTNLITRDYGSWIFLGEIILDIELKFDLPFLEDLCGTCTACLDACPTNAFPEPYILDSSKCISYLTIEHKGDFSNNFNQNLSGWIYGCDICQTICPWNIKFSKTSNESSFKIRESIAELSNNDWFNLSKLDFQKLFKKSAIKRTKYIGLKRNINTLKRTNN